ANEEIYTITLTYLPTHDDKVNNRNTTINKKLLTSNIVLFYLNNTTTTEIHTLSLHDALPIWEPARRAQAGLRGRPANSEACASRSEEHTSELQSPYDLVCRLLLEKKKESSQ